MLGAGGREVSLHGTRQLDEAVDHGGRPTEPHGIVQQHDLEREGAAGACVGRARAQHLEGGVGPTPLGGQPPEGAVAIAPEQAVVVGPERRDAVDVAPAAVGVAAEESGHADERQHPALGPERARGPHLERVGLARGEGGGRVAGEELDARPGEGQPRDPAPHGSFGGRGVTDGAGFGEPAELGQGEELVEQQDRASRSA